MITKLRFEPKELEILRFLSRRLELPLKNENQYLHLEKGYAGEQHLTGSFRTCQTLALF